MIEQLHLPMVFPEISIMPAHRTGMLSKEHLQIVMIGGEMEEATGTTMLSGDIPILVSLKTKMKSQITLFKMEIRQIFVNYPVTSSMRILMVME